MTNITHRLDQLESSLRGDGLPEGITVEWVWDFTESGSGHWVFRNQAGERVPCPAGVDPDKIEINILWDWALPASG